MARFQIRTEHLPSRCDICHQADFFDPSTGQCGRCEGVLATAFQSPPPAPTARFRWQLDRLGMNPLMYFIFCGGLLNVVFHAFTAGPAPPTRVPKAPGAPVTVSAAPSPVRPEFTFDEKQAEIGNLLTDSEMNLGMAVNRLKGRIMTNPVLEQIEGIPGIRFSVRIGDDEFDCFCPRIDLLSDTEFAILQRRIRPQNRITLYGRYDTGRRLIFLSRMILDKEPFRGPGNPLV